jgi:glutaredoxin
MRLPPFAIALCLAFSLGAAHAQQLYRWTDSAGGVHVTDTPPPKDARNVEEKDYGGGSLGNGQLPYALRKAMKDAPVTLYTSPSCKNPCSLARAALNRRGVPFKEVVVLDAQTNAELQRVSGARQVPTLVVGNAVQKGFSQSAFDGELDVAGYPKSGVLPARHQSAPAAPNGGAEQGGGTSGSDESGHKPLGPYAPHFSNESK